MTRTLTGVLATLLLATVFAAQLPAAEFAVEFAHPAARFRILKIVHGLPGTPQEQDRLLEKLKSQQFGGMVTNVPFADYLQSESQWQVFLGAVAKAKKAGLALWLYDEHGYPSGVAAGLTMQGHPEWEARGLLVADAVRTAGAVTLELPPGRLVRAVAFPQTDGRIALDKAVELADRVSDRKLTWEAPPGSWHVMAITEDRLYDGTHAAVSLADKLPYINLLQPEPTARFLQITHEAYAARLGPDLGRSFIGTFTDEPSLMSLFMRRQPYRPCPWAANLPAEFQKRRGYALEPLLPALVADAGPPGARARYDFWLTVGELVAQNYFGQIRDWCRQHQIPSGGHLLLEEPLLMHVALYGDLFRCERMLDAPSLDCLTSLPPEVHWYSARLISSAAELQGRPDTMCETSDHAQRFRPTGDKRPPRGVTEDEIRGTCNRLILNGMTCITSYYSFAGLSDEQLRRLNLWVGRCCAMLYGGQQVTDVALVYPIESVWPRFTPSRHNTADAIAAQPVAQAYHGTAEQLFAHRWDFTFIDARTLTEADAAGGTLRYRNLAWRAIVLPAVDTLPMAAWRNLAKFWREGGIVVAVGALPTNSEQDFPAPAVKALAREIFGDGPSPGCQVNTAGGVGVHLPLGAMARVPKVLSRIFDPEVRTADAGVPVRVTHRRIDGQEVFFLINDAPQPWQGTVDLMAQGPGWRCEPATGAVTRLSGPDRIDVQLGPYGGVLFRFDQPRQPARRNVTVQAMTAIAVGSADN